MTTGQRTHMAWNKRARNLVIERCTELLQQAGVPADRLWHAYRNDVLLVYYRRLFGAARPLLWNYWKDHPADWRVLAYTLVTLLPGRWVARWRGELPPTTQGLATEVAATDAARWTSALQEIRYALAG
jgi:hypothetical protein